MNEETKYPGGTVWTASVTEALALPHATSGLSESERARAARYRQDADRNRFVAGRALLRHALSQESGDQRAPGQWQFSIGADGKPEISGGPTGIHINLSHSGDCVAAAVSTAGPIGVDIERALPDSRLEVVPDVLTAREQNMLRFLRGNERWMRFIRIWTIKEACGKALGLGMGIEFTTFEVGLDPLDISVAEGVLPRTKGFSLSEHRVSEGSVPYAIAAATITDSRPTQSHRFKML